MMVDGMRFLVTGGAGAIGSNLVRRLLGRAELVAVLDDLSSGHERLLPTDDRIKFIRGSIADDRSLNAAFDTGPEAVFHLAANFANQNSVDHPGKDLQVNGMGTLRLLERATEARCRHFVYASSSCVYGDMSGGGDEESAAIKLDTPYAITKMLGERYVSFFHEHYGLPTVILRLFNSYGPGELPGKYRNVIPNFFKLALEGKPLPIFGTGEETRAYNYVENVVEAFVRTLNYPASIGETMNIGHDHETTTLELAEKVNRIAGNGAGVTMLPRRSWDHVARRTADIAKARSLIGYEPMDALDKGLEATCQWLLSVKDEWFSQDAA